eukprot:UN09474
MCRRAFSPLPSIYDNQNRDLGCSYLSTKQKTDCIIALVYQHIFQ